MSSLQWRFVCLSNGQRKLLEKILKSIGDGFHLLDGVFFFLEERLFVNLCAKERSFFFFGEVEEVVGEV